MLTVGDRNDAMDETTPETWLALSSALGLGLLILATMFAGWFGNVINESESRMYNAAVDRSFRMGMMWFIFSEVMFFAAFFGALWYARQYSVPWLGGEGVKVFTKFLLNPGFEPAWPTNGPQNVGGEFSVIPAFGLPAVNTAILLTSGVTVTIAHHALKVGNRAILNTFLAATFLLGFTFVYLQATEYIEAYQLLLERGVNLESGWRAWTLGMVPNRHAREVMGVPVSGGHG